LGLNGGQITSGSHENSCFHPLNDLTKCAETHFSGTRPRNHKRSGRTILPHQHCERSFFRFAAQSTFPRVSEVSDTHRSEQRAGVLASEIGAGTRGSGCV
jgi:hypothetical protein